MAIGQKVQTNDSRPGVLSGQVALVTGATGLLGREHCFALANEGARIVVADVDKRACNQFAEEITRSFRVPALGVELDVTKEASVAACVETVLGQYERIDVLVNNAAINDKFTSASAAADESRIENYPLEQWQRSIDVNVTGVFLCCKHVGAAMARRGSGSIINIASTYGLVAPDQRLYQRPDGSQPFFKTIVYPASKGAVLAMTRYLAAYWGTVGVRVNSLSPGGVENGQEEYFVKNYAERTPLGRMARPDDYRGAIVFLAGPASQYMTGSNVVVDGGFTIW